MSGNEGDKVIARLIPGELVRPEDARRIDAGLREQLSEGMDSLVPLLARLLRRSGSWGPAEQQEWSEAVEQMTAAALEWAREELRRCALPKVERRPGKDR